MSGKLWMWFQCLIPGYLVEFISKKIAESRLPWFKNALIRHYIKKHQIDLSRLKNRNINDYPTFNAFFIRELNNAAKGASNIDELSSPAESIITEFGKIAKETLIQAKQQTFKLSTLLSHDKHFGPLFVNGDYMIFFLDVYNYHRYHMPIDGKLEYSIYVPHASFDLDPASQRNVPELYCRNEHYIAFFDTEIGKIGIVLIGALFVGGIQMRWMKEPFTSKKVIKQYHNNIFLKKDDELGIFKYGSSIILLLEKNHIQWNSSVQKGKAIRVGSDIATIVSPHSLKV